MYIIMIIITKFIIGIFLPCPVVVGFVNDKFERAL